MFSIAKLAVQSKEGKQLGYIEDVSFLPGTISLLVGKNGSGKTSFLHGLFLHPSIVCGDRDISLDQDSISKNSLLDMYAKGLHYVPQHLIPLPGVSFISFLHTAYEIKFAEKIPLPMFIEKVKKISIQYGLPQCLIEKNVHENLSGGERKMQELIQTVVLKPKYLFLDEIDAGLDRDAKIILGKVLNTLKVEGVGIILVSHSFEFTELLTLDTVYLMDNGKIVRTGGLEILQDIKKDGFSE